MCNDTSILSCTLISYHAHYLWQWHTCTYCECVIQKKKVNVSPFPTTPLAHDPTHICVILLPVPQPTQQCHRTYLWVPAPQKKISTSKLILQPSLILQISQWCSVQGVGSLSVVSLSHSVTFVTHLQTATERGFVYGKCELHKPDSGPASWVLTGTFSVLVSTNLESSSSVTAWPAEYKTTFRCRVLPSVSKSEQFYHLFQYNYIVHNCSYLGNFYINGLWHQTLLSLQCSYSGDSNEYKNNKCKQMVIMHRSAQETNSNQL